MGRKSFRFLQYSHPKNLCVMPFVYILKECTIQIVHTLHIIYLWWHNIYLDIWIYFHTLTPIFISSVSCLFAVSHVCTFPLLVHWDFKQFQCDLRRICMFLYHVNKFVLKMSCRGHKIAFWSSSWLVTLMSLVWPRVRRPRRSRPPWTLLITSILKTSGISIKKDSFFTLVKCLA